MDKKFSVEVYKREKPIIELPIEFTQNDLGVCQIKFNFYEDFNVPYDLSDEIIILTVNKPNGAVNDEDVTVLDSSSAICTLSPASIDASGKAICTLKAYKDGNRLSWGDFKVKIKEDTPKGSSGSADNEFNALTSLVGKVNNVVSNEDERISNEKDRVVSETYRKKDYDSLKKIIIDENNAANLQNQINTIKPINDKVPGIEEKLKYVPSFPLASFEVFVDVKDFTKPYLHIERYGADPLGVKCSSLAIQKCIDMSEVIAGLRLGSFPILFGNGYYLVTKGLKIKCVRDESTASRPLTILGVERRHFYSYPGHGSTIIPQIPNFKGKDYANLFTVNLTFNGDDDEIGVTAQEKSRMIDNIMISNLSILLSETDRYQYNINMIKAFRTRMYIDNIFTTGLNKVVWEPTNDSAGNFNYCDSSVFNNIRADYIKTNILDLHYPDNTEINGIVAQYPEPTVDSFIKINYGAGISVDKLLFSFHAKYRVTDSNPILIPRNDGVVGGDTAYLKMENVEGITIKGLDIERTLLSSVFNIRNCNNITIDNTFEKFIGNTYAVFRGDNSNISINNANRNMNIVDNFVDLEYRTGAKVRGLRVNNCRRRNFYTQEGITTSYSDAQYLALNPSANPVAKHITSNFTRGMETDSMFEQIVLQVKVDGSVLTISDRNDNINLNGKYINAIIDGDGIVLSHVDPKGILILKEVNPLYRSKSVVPSIPVLRNMNSDKVHFIKNNTFLNTVDDTCGFLVTLETLKV